MQKPKYLIGIDEAGRGPLAGPVAVGVVLVPIGFDWNMIKGVGDSKAMSENKRDVIYKEARQLEKKGLLQMIVTLVSAQQIDNQGINVAIKTGIERGLNKISSRFNLERDRNVVMIKLDGGLKAPIEYIHQETIIKGDAKEKVIGLASIMAKVTRDRYMRRRATVAVFAPYDFARHKGYGTKAHRTAIAKYGLSTEHRASYCKNIQIM